MAKVATKKAAAKKSAPAKKRAPAKSAKGKGAPAKTGAKKQSPTVLAKAAALAVESNQRNGEDALALIARRIEQITEAFYDIGLALQVLERKEVYAALGFGAFDELVEARTPISRAVAFELLKIPTHLSREAAVALGREKATALIRHVEATPEDDSAEALVRGDAVIGGRPVSEQTAAAIEGAASAVRKKTAKKSKSKAREGEHEADAVAARLEKDLELEAEQDLRVVPVKKPEGWWLRFDVPIALGAKITTKKR